MMPGKKLTTMVSYYDRARARTLFLPLFHTHTHTRARARAHTLKYTQSLWPYAFWDD